MRSASESLLVGLSPGDVIGGRRNYFDARAPEVEVASAGERENFHIFGAGLFAHGRPGCAGGHGAGPKLGGVEVFDDGGQPAGVIVVGMRERYNVDFADGAAPEIGRHDILADVDDEKRGVGPKESTPPPSISSSFRIREADQQTIALSDIDRRELEFARVQPAGKDARRSARRAQHGGERAQDQRRERRIANASSRSAA